MAHDTHGEHHTLKRFPPICSAPSFVDGWRSRALVVAAVAAIAAVILAFLGQSQDQLGWDHVYRAWVLGMLLTFGWTVGGLALLMVQYCSGGKWGLLLRRPLEAATRTLPLVFGYWVVSAIFMKKLYLWAQYTNPGDTESALKSRPDQRNSGPLPRLQAPHAEPDDLCDRHAPLLRHLGLLHLAAQ